MAVFLLCPYMIHGMKEVSGVSFVKILIQFVKALPSLPNHFPKASPPHTITLETRFQHVNLERHKHSVYSTGVSPSPPPMKNLLFQLQGVLLVNTLKLSFPSRIALAWPMSQLFLEHLTSNKWLLEKYKDLAIHAQLRTNLRGHSSSRAPFEVS